MHSFTAQVRLDIQAPPSRVWQALTDPSQIRQYLHGTEASSDWKEGSPLEFRGEWKGTAYHDRGIIQKIVPGQLLRYTWLSSMSGLEDKPENYSVITYELRPEASGTELVLTQENIPTSEGKKASETNWLAVLQQMKKIIES